jgi:hypothetical protein
MKRAIPIAPWHSRQMLGQSPPVVVLKMKDRSRAGGVRLWAVGRLRIERGQGRASLVLQLHPLRMCNVKTKEERPGTRKREVGIATLPIRLVAQQLRELSYLQAGIRQGWPAALWEDGESPIVAWHASIRTLPPRSYVQPISI